MRSLLLLLLPFAAAQTPPASPPAFEVASIKRSPPDHVGAQLYSASPGRLTTLTTTVKNLIAYAYGVPDFRVLGGPAWSEGETYDITAKAAGSPTNAELKVMMQQLLASRFHLTVHSESKEASVYHLVVAKSGPKLKPADKGLGIGFGKGLLNGRGADMATLASVLTGRLGRTVIDQTGIEGFYEFTLAWAPDEAASGDTTTSIFAALQEQLGLKLEAAKGPVEMFVIDRVERPSEN
jgi:uncharacterized protein (TIGR03435 family)